MSRTIALRKIWSIGLLFLLLNTSYANDTLINFATSVSSPGSSWKYLANGTDLGASTWKLSSYSDAAWSTGNSELGYGDGDENTVVGYGGNASLKYITTYFRKTINIANPAAYSSFKMEVKRDDGIIVFVNGTEVYRNNIATGSTYTTLATNATDDGETILSTTLAASAFTTGNNTIAVEIHQTNATSTDISFDMRLVGIKAITSAPVVSSSSTASAVVGTSFSYTITASNSPTSYGATGLPSGLSVNTSTGIISGTPTAAGTFNTTISATNAIGTGTKALVITITQPTPVVSSSGTASAVVGTSFSYSITASNSPNSYGATGLPAGLNVNTSTGLISGTPTAAGTFNTTISATNTGGTGTKALTITITNPIPPSASDTFINFATSTSSPGSSWKYLDNGTDLGSTTWKLASYSDAAWASGNSELGYGDGDENTTVGFGGNTSNRFITTYFRKSINITNPNAYTAFKMEVKRDDGIIVFVNGTEVYRNNIATGSTYTTLATNASDDGETVFSATLPTSAFVAGNNIVAVEIHQTNATSTDISFDMRLIGTTGSTAVVSRGAYLQMGNETAITIRWRTDVATNSKVTWGTSFGTYPNSINDATQTTEHVMRLTGLTADTKYYYTIGTSTTVLQSASSNNFVTAPPANATRKLRFLALGDCGNNSTNQVNVKNTFINYIGSNNVDAMILLGDNAYNTGTDAEFQSNFFNVYKDDLLRYYKLYPAPGNHDYGNTQSNAGVRNNAYYNSFTMPTAAECGGVASGTKAYYSFNIGSVHFISLDSYGKENSNTTRMYDTTGAQITWLKADLAANTKRWVVVFFHHPPHTKVGHDSDTETELVSIRQNVTPILERYGVDLILCGHSHGYERSYLLKGYTTGETTFNKTLHTPNNDTLNALYNGSVNSCPYTYNSGLINHGAVYVVSGSAGQIGGSSSGYPHNAMRYSNNSNGGCFYFEVDSNRLDAKFISYTTAPTPVVRDQFTIFKDVKKVQNITVQKNSPLLLTASWKGTYNWPALGGATTQSVSPSTATAGTFDYIVKDSYNCIKDSFHITVTAPLARLANPPVNNFKNDFTVRAQIYFGSDNIELLIRTNISGPVQMKIVDASGRVVKKESLVMNSGSYMKSVQLKKGMYVAELTNKNGERTTTKFIVR